MKHIVLFALIISISVLSYGQRKIKKLEVNEEGLYIKMKFQPVTDKINSDGLIYKITPISADELNSLFLEESKFNGKFEYSHYEKSRRSYFLNKPKRKHEKSDFEFMLEGANWLLDNKEITQQEHDGLVIRIYIYFDKEVGKQMYDVSQIISANPYYIKNKYLNVFKIQITNTTNSNLTFDKKISIESGYSMLNALSSDQIIEELERSNLLNNDKVLALNRHNLPDVLSIPPNSKFEKLFAIPPINYDNPTLIISLTNVDTKFKWEVIKDKRIINELYTFYVFDMNWYYSGYKSGLGLDAIYLKKSQPSIFLHDDELFISEDFLGEGFEVITISLLDDKLYFGRNIIKGTDYIDAEKTKRQTISIKTHSIVPLKKVVKE